MKAVTKTRAQAIARARGIWGARAAWVESPKEEVVRGLAREAMCDFLDHLTLLVRSLDLLHLQAVRATIGKLRREKLDYGAPFHIGEGFWHGRMFVRTMKAQGWSWDEAFEKAEARLATEERSAMKETGS